MSGGDKGESTPRGPSHPEALEGEDGIWRNADGHALPVSASDLERFTYCPMSWHLSTQGHSGQSEAIEQGKEEHRAIHESIETMQQHRFRTRRNLLIWQWWFGVIVVLTIDTVAFQNAENINFDSAEFSKLMAMASLSCLMVGMAAVFVPWRKVLNVAPKYPDRIRDAQDSPLVDPVFEPVDFKGGWMEGGWIEAAMFISAIVLAVHAMALRFASNQDQAAFVLAVTTIGWMLLASVRLQRALISNHEAQVLAAKNDIAEDTQVTYSDDEKTAQLLVDEKTGLRGRPDQIVIIDGELIPVEQKTGKVPQKPHRSHVVQVLAYAALVDNTTGKKPPYCIVRYGQENLHQIPWDEDNQILLYDAVKAVQRTMAKGGAARNHERAGKCRHCSRRYACEDSLV